MRINISTLLCLFIILLSNPLICLPYERLCVEGVCFGDSLSKVISIMEVRYPKLNKITIKGTSGDTTYRVCWRTIYGTKLNCEYIFTHNKLSSIIYEGFGQEEIQRKAIEREFTKLFGKSDSSSLKTLGGGVGQLKSSFEGMEQKWQRRGLLAEITYYSPVPRKRIVRGTINPR